MYYLTHRKLPHGKHGFFTRNGGVSTGVYDSANMSYASGDSVDNIDINRQRVKTALGIRHLITLNQVHGNRVHTVDADTMSHFAIAPVDGDGLVCTVSGVGIGILTADCVPVLFADTQNQVIGACHAGWGGARQGVALRTVDAMLTQGANVRTIVAVVGPSIAQYSYEVDNTFKQNFCCYTPEYNRYFIPWHSLNSPVPNVNRDSYGFDLSGYIIDSLWAYGVRTFAVNKGDTYTQPDIFFSYRRTTHAGDTDYGRQISVISL